MTELLEVLVCALVDHPDDVEVTDEGIRRDTVFLKVRVNPRDTGKVIGKHGKIVNSIRTVVRHAAARQNLRAEVDITS